MKAARFTSKIAAREAIKAMGDVNTPAPVWGAERAQEIGGLIYDISGHFTRRRVNRPGLIFSLAGAYRDLRWLDTETSTRVSAWLDTVSIQYRGARDLNAYPHGIDVANPNDNAAAEVFFAETAALHEIAHGDLHSLTAFYLLYKQDWQDCQSLQNEYFTLTGKYYGDYLVV